MELQIFSVFDKKTVIYGRPIFAHNAGHVMRMLVDEMSNPESMLAKHPEDYSLFQLGKFDDGSGHISVEQVVHVIELLDLVKKE